MQVRAALIIVAVAAMSFGFSRGTSAQQRQRPAAAGMVKSVDDGAKSFVITVGRRGQTQDVTIKTDANTKFLKAPQTEASFADVKVGKYAAVAGEGTAATGITATQVIIADRAPARGTTGTVKSVDTTTKTIVITIGREGAQARDVTVKWTDTTKVMVGRQAGKLDDIAVGKRIRVQGEGNARQGFTATEIVVLPAAPGAGQ
jgi:hypothetical protein